MEWDDTGWKNISFPVSSYPVNLSKSSVVWFRIRLRFSSENGNLRNKSVGLYTGKLSDDAEVYFNGALIGTSGAMPPEKFFGTPNVPRYFIIPGKLIEPGKDSVLAIKIHNIRVKLDFGNIYIQKPSNVLANYQLDFFLNSTIAMITSVLALLVCFYFLFLYIREPKNRFYL